MTAIQKATLGDLHGVTGTVHVIGNQVLFETEGTVYVIEKSSIARGYFHKGRGNGVQPEVVAGWVEQRKAGVPVRTIAEAAGYSHMTVYNKVKAVLADEVAS